MLLHEFVALNREEIVRRCRTKVATRSLPAPTDAEIDHGVPLFLDQVVDALRLGLSSSAEIGKSGLRHGHELLLQGFTMSQVVMDYGDVCQTVTGLAVELHAPISTDDFRSLNLCLDEAIAGAVTAYGSGQNQTAVHGESARGNERLVFLAHEVQNLTNTALLALEALKTGKVGITGSTAMVLENSLAGLSALAVRSLTDVRRPSNQDRSQFPVSGFIDDLVPAATLEANARGIRFDVLAVENGVLVEADRRVLASAVGNLLQNAFKFTDPGTTVTLRVGANAERVLIEVLDECGGLPDGTVTELFRPFDEVRLDGTCGLGLAFSRWGVEANDGRITARNLPKKGCIFTIDLPRIDLSSEMIAAISDPRSSDTTVN